MSRRFDFYQVKRNDNLADPTYWNRRLEDIDLRIAAREADAENIDEATANLEALGLQRLNETFTPLILDAQERLNTIGVSFSAESTTSNTVGTGAKVFNLTEETRGNYVNADYVDISAFGTSPIVKMKGLVTNYNRGTGDLSVTIVQTTGAGTFADWNVGFGLPPEAGAHADRTDNPHLTTAAQVGAYTIAQIDSIVNGLEELIGESAGALLATNNLSDLSNVPAARTALGLGSAALKTAGTGANQLPSLDANAKAPPLNMLNTTLTDAATIQWDQNNGIIATVVLGATGRTFANPTNLKIGGSVAIIKQDGTGNRTITAWGNLFKWVGGAVPVLSTGANAVDTISLVYDGSLIYASWSPGYA